MGRRLKPNLSHKGGSQGKGEEISGKREGIAAWDGEKSPKIDLNCHPGKKDKVKRAQRNGEEGKRPKGSRLLGKKTNRIADLPRALDSFTALSKKKHNWDRQEKSA